MASKPENMHALHNRLLDISDRLTQVVCQLDSVVNKLDASRNSSMDQSESEDVPEKSGIIPKMFVAVGDIEEVLARVSHEVSIMSSILFGDHAEENSTADRVKAGRAQKPSGM